MDKTREEFLKFCEEMQDRMQNGTPEQKLEVCKILYEAFHGEGSFSITKPAVKPERDN